MALRTAILSDIHGNLEALEAVLADASAHGVERAVCLGDILGFGADVVACVDRVRESCEWSLAGDHEWMLREYLGGNSDPNPAARAYMDWEAGLLVPGKMPELADKRRWDWVRRLEVQKWEGKFTFVHGSPTDPIRGWVTLSEGALPEVMKAEFEIISGPCFQGHTHVPGVIRTGGIVSQVGGPDEVVEVEPAEKALINVGSVGQPRDDNPAASYVIHEGCEVRFRRVPYAFERTIAKIQAVSAISGVQGERLRYGR